MGRWWSRCLMVSIIDSFKASTSQGQRKLGINLRHFSWDRDKKGFDKACRSIKVTKEYLEYGIPQIPIKLFPTYASTLFLLLIYTLRQLEVSTYRTYASLLPPLYFSLLGDGGLGWRTSASPVKMRLFRGAVLYRWPLIVFVRSII